MARLEEDELSGRETSLVFIAKNVKEAEKVEALLTDNDVEFVVALEKYVSGLLFPSERAGIGFHALVPQASAARALLKGKFKAGLVEEPRPG